ncbi:MAG: type II toxin-antitoxin system PemK/MazF family toxin [Bradymonadaceae bacterium]
MGRKAIGLGDIWIANLEPVVGHEQGRTRPVLIVSKNAFNQLPLKLVWTVPLTTTQKDYPDWVPIEAPEAGLDRDGRIICSQLRCISTDRLHTRIGTVHQTTLDQVKAVLTRILV